MTLTKEQMALIRKFILDGNRIIDWAFAGDEDHIEGTIETRIRDTLKSLVDLSKGVGMKDLTGKRQLEIAIDHVKEALIDV